MKSMDASGSKNESSSQEANTENGNSELCRCQHQEVSSGCTDRRKKREEKAIDSILQVLNVLQSPEEKLAALCSKYANLAEENRLLQQTLKHTQKNYSTLSKEKERLEADNGKLILARHKLETLCRELQKSNKEIKEESIQRAREQDDKRKEVSEKFQTALNELHTAMASGKERSSKLYEENASLAHKLQALVEQYEVKDEHSKKLLATRELEIQLLQAKLDSTSLQMQQLSEVYVKEKEQILLVLNSKEQQIQALLHGETQLKEQLSEYSQKYDDFQNSLKQSNTVFQSFKGDMDKMTKRLTKSVKENEQWRNKYESVNNKVVTLLEQKSALEKEKASLQKNNLTMTSLCRTLHTELSKLQKVCESKTDTARIDYEKMENSTTGTVDESGGVGGRFSETGLDIACAGDTGESANPSQCLEMSISEGMQNPLCSSSFTLPSEEQHEDSGSTFDVAALADEEILASSFTCDNEESFDSEDLEDETSFSNGVQQCASEI